MGYARRLILTGALCLMCAAYAGAARAAGSSVGSGERITTTVSPRRLPPGAATTISGTLAGAGGPLAGRLLELQIDPRPYGRFVNVAHSSTDSVGRYSFAPVRIDRDTRLRVLEVAPDGPSGPTVTVLARAPAYPSGQRVRAAARYLARRAGRRSFAVVDDHDRLAGMNIHMRFHSASVVKSILLVAYLRMLGRAHRSLDRPSQALLYPMIHSSDNGAASAVLAIVGEDALDRVARDAGMADYEPGGGTWGFTEVSAADLARFFYRQDALIPRRFVAYARWLLSTIEAGESWGMPAVARPEFRVYFKGGWLPEVEGLVNQAGRLERPRVTFALAVLTTHDPSMLYGEHTIEGVTARLLGRAP
jgi:hypothetical protein